MFDAPIDYPEQYYAYVRLFNERDYFEAHEVLEDLWVMEVGALRDYYKGMIMSAVALLHWQRGNLNGARKLYLRTEECFAPYGALIEGFELAQFRLDMAELFAPLLTLPETGQIIPAPPIERHPVLRLQPVTN